MEIQIKPTEMDIMAEGGVASHSLYKGGLTDPEEAQWLKETMLAAAEVTALHLKDLPSTNHRGNLEIDSKNPLFFFTDENGDGRISLEELTKVMEDFGAGGKDALELMQLLDANNDGFLISEEFDLLQKQVGFMRNTEDTDDHYRNTLGAKFQVLTALDCFKLSKGVERQTIGRRNLSSAAIGLYQTVPFVIC